MLIPDDDKYYKPVEITIVTRSIAFSFKSDFVNVKIYLMKTITFILRMENILYISKTTCSLAG